MWGFLLPSKHLETRPSFLTDWEGDLSPDGHRGMSWDVGSNDGCVLSHTFPFPILNNAMGMMPYPLLMTGR
jgi:hypothetical protein